MVVFEHTMIINATKEDAPYASLLTLNAANFNASKSIQFNESGGIQLNLGGVNLNNDITIARLIAQSSNNEKLTGSSFFQKAQIDEVVTLCEQAFAGFLVAEEILNAQSYSKDGTLFEGTTTVADLALFALLMKNEKLKTKFSTLFNAIVANPQLYEAHSIVRKVQVPKPPAGTERGTSSGKPKEKKKDEGKFVELPGAEKGKVVVRFPPEASGYLHIGHAKAALLNQYYQQAFDGQLIMRFDDTNPAKENAHFEQVIKEDLAMLQIVPDIWTHSSDHFDTMLKMCEKLLREGKAFVDDTDTETMRNEREQRKNSKNRDNAPDVNLALWEEMKKGSARGQQCCVRIKIDMNSNNGAMRDPTIYRCKIEHHVRTGDKYKVYPTYDFACPIVDSIEGVTHALRTTEYHDRDDQYYFICDALSLRKPYIWEYARLNMTNTVMSKRKLTWFVEENVVEGWDDPRFPTVRGVLRRGMTVEGLKQFIVAQGGSRSVVMMEWDKIWAFNKKVIDPVAPRYTALDRTNVLVPVLIEPSIAEESANIALHPKNADVGEKVIYRGGKILIEQVDANQMQIGDTVTFVNWGNLKIVSVEKKGDCVNKIIAQLDLENKDYKKTLKVTWIGDVSSQSSIPVVGADYDHIISKAVIAKDEDWKNYINYDSVHYTKMLGEPALKAVKKGEIIQIQRKGYYICDHPYVAKSEFTGDETPLLLIAIPDGHVKDQPTATSANKIKASPASTHSALVSAGDDLNLYNQIDAQGALVRELKAKDPKGQETKDAIAKLLDLKKQFKEKTGQEYKPGSAPVATHGTSAGTVEESLAKQIDAQGTLVRELKGKDAKSSETIEAIAKLLDLKKQFKEKTGKDYAPIVSNSVGKKKEGKKQPKKEEDRDGKKTKLGIETKKEENYSEWYSQVITKAEMIEYYDVSGCYVLRPWSFAIWEVIKKWFNVRIKRLGVKNCYFPMFVSQAALEREKAHIEDFAPEVAWVTRAGNSIMAEPVAIRPTSETVMYPSYKKWVQSHRDLPIKLNQWCNVVRWEFKHPTPFLRTREFLWQEGHTAYANPEDAEREVFQILDLYEGIYQDLMAVPVIKGRKSEKEKFAGGKFTTTVEAYIPVNGRGVQGATSHHLGQNFSKMFDISYEDPSGNGEKAFAWQNSWGLTTRTIGALVMVHGDDNGLVLPPRVAAIQVIVMAVGITATTLEKDRQKLNDTAKAVVDQLLEIGIRAEGDFRDNYSPGWKFNHWELKGVPIRVEIGPKDLANRQITAVYRFNGKKITVPLSEITIRIPATLDEIHTEMFNKVKAARDSHMKICTNFPEFKRLLDDKFILFSPFCGAPSCEENVKRDSTREEGDGAQMGAKSLCIPLEQPTQPLPSNCIHPECISKPTTYALFGRSY